VTDRGDCPGPGEAEVAVLSVQTEACRALSAENERLKAENAALRDDGGELIGEVYTTDGVGIVMRTITRVRAERDAALAKLKLPCGSCHPCLNWADETWRREGRKPPTVQAWEDVQAERDLALAEAARFDEPVAAPTLFERMLADSAEQFGGSELLPKILAYIGLSGDDEQVKALMRSIEEYRDAPPCAASAPKEPTP
jgi:hypothetical protein